MFLTKIVTHRDILFETKTNFCHVNNSQECNIYVREFKQIILLQMVCVGSVANSGQDFIYLFTLIYVFTLAVADS